MQRISPVAVLLILLCSAFSVATGVLLDGRSPANTANYRAIYYAARTAFQGRDPYRPGDFNRVYNAESGALPGDPFQKQLFLRAVPVCVNLPTTLFLIVPLAKLSWDISRLIWLVLIAVCFTIAGILAYDLGRDYSPRLSLVLVCLMLANSEVLFIVGNTAGVAVSLCVIALWTVIRQKSLWVGSVLLAFSLALKPHDSGLLWLLLLVIGGASRKRAIWSLLIVCAIAIPALLWITSVAPDWRHELSANLSATSQRGDISDPGPASMSRRNSADVIISLQTALSVLRDDPVFYNPASLLICASLLAMILFRTMRTRAVFPDAWFAIAAIAALTMLPSYHRPYDARLLLLAVPASTMLWADGGRMQKAIALIAASAIVITADIPLALISILTRNLSVDGMSLAGRLVVLPIIRPAPLVLLLLAALFTIVYIQRTGVASRLRNPAENPALIGN